MGTTFTAPDRASYRLGFMPDVWWTRRTCTPWHDNQNTAISTRIFAAQRVYPQSFDCNIGGTTKPSWLVLGNNPGNLAERKSALFTS